MERDLIAAIQTASPDGDELAFIALTSKPELHVRDRVAYRLHERLSPDVQVAREWKRTDLALLDRDNNPIALVEVKAFHSWFAVSDKRLKAWRARVRADIEKASELARTSAAPNAEIYALLVVTHVEGDVTGAGAAVKYQRRLRHEVSWPDAEAKLKDFLREDESPSQTPLGTGEAFGLRATLTAWLYGPVSARSE